MADECLEAFACIEVPQLGNPLAYDNSEDGRVTYLGGVIITS